MLFYNMMCYAMVRYVALPYVMTRYVTWCYVVMRYVMLCYLIRSYVMVRYAILWYDAICSVMVCYAMIWDAVVWRPYAMKHISAKRENTNSQNNVCLSIFRPLIQNFAKYKTKHQIKQIARVLFCLHGWFLLIEISVIIFVSSWDERVQCYKYVHTASRRNGQTGRNQPNLDAIFPNVPQALVFLV